MIVLLWLFQIVFLNDYYQAIKKNEIQKTAQTISQNIDNENVETLIDQIGDRFDVRVEVADMEEMRSIARILCRTFPRVNWR